MRTKIKIKMAAVNRRRRLLACYLLLRDILRRRRERENIEESIGFGLDRYSRGENVLESSIHSFKLEGDFVDVRHISAI